MRPFAVALFALAIGALPLAGGDVAEASSAGGDHDAGECPFSQGI